MKFWAGGVSYPFKSHDTWFMAENIRWGKFAPDTDIKALVDQVNREDIWRDAAKDLGVAAADIPASHFARQGNLLRRQGLRSGKSLRLSRQPRDQGRVLIPSLRRVTGAPASSSSKERLHVRPGHAMKRSSPAMTAQDKRKRRRTCAKQPAARIDIRSQIASAAAPQRRAAARRARGHSRRLADPLFGAGCLPAARRTRSGRKATT